MNLAYAFSHQSIYRLLNCIDAGKWWSVNCWRDIVLTICFCYAIDNLRGSRYWTVEKFRSKSEIIIHLCDFEWSQFLSLFKWRLRSLFLYWSFAMELRLMTPLIPNQLAYKWLQYNVAELHARPKRMVTPQTIKSDFVEEFLF